MAGAKVLSSHFNHEIKAQQAAVLAKIDTFEISKRAAAVTIEDGGKIAVKSTDGRTASGWMDEGEWFLCEVNGIAIDSCNPKIERLAEKAKKEWGK